MTEFFEPVRDRISFVVGDVTDAAALERLPASQITHVIHAAAVTHVPSELDLAERFVDGNVRLDERGGRLVVTTHA